MLPRTQADYQFHGECLDVKLEVPVERWKRVNIYKLPQQRNELIGKGKGVTRKELDAN